MTIARDLKTVRDAASQWVARRDAGLSATEESEFQAWRDASPAHAEAMARYERLWDRIDGPRTANAGPQLNQEISKLDNRQRRSRRGLATACVLALCGLGIAGWALRPGAEVAREASSVAVLAPEHRVLPDGSVVEYPAGASVTVDFSSPEVRRVTLDRGEAHFAVAKNPARPFIVHAGGVDVRAVGTAFAVQLASSAVDVIVTEGRVAVDRPAEAAAPAVPSSTTPAPSATATFVGAGEKLSFATQVPAGASAGRAEAIFPAELEQRLAWRNPRMEFSNTPLPEVVAAINRHADAHGGVHFTLAGSSLDTVRLSGIFRVDDTRSFIGILETGFSIKAERTAPNAFELRHAP